MRSTSIAESGDIYGWPSRGGVIDLSDAVTKAYEFLALDPLDASPHRYHDQDAEYNFRQQLLLLGVKWKGKDNDTSSPPEYNRLRMDTVASSTVIVMDHSRT